MFKFLLAIKSKKNDTYLSQLESQEAIGNIFSFPVAPTSFKSCVQKFAFKYWEIGNNKSCQLSSCLLVTFGKVVRTGENSG